MKTDCVFGQQSQVARIRNLRCWQMLVSDFARLVLTTALTTMVLTNSIEMWMLYLFNLLFGVAAGFFIPASNAIVPGLVKKATVGAILATRST